MSDLGFEKRFSPLLTAVSEDRFASILTQTILPEPLHKAEIIRRNQGVWEGTGFAQDDYRITKSLTMNIGLRYEHLGQFADRLGRNASFDISKADPNPPPGGSTAGYVVASNFRGDLPPGVLRKRAHTCKRYFLRPQRRNRRAFGFAM